jgi:superoxide dismutase, Cu-Zn family
MVKLINRKIAFLLGMTLFCGQCLATDVLQDVKTAKSVLHPTKGNQAAGVVSFTAMVGGVRIVADLEGLSPGDHGFHIHEFGDCSAPDASSAGGHFNPSKNSHGSPNNAERHAGDLGNITADDSGKAHYDRIDKVIELNGENTIIGRSIIVHAKADDFITQPTGNAGSRVACGVIEVE